jgi:hypothetical protein
MTPGGSDPNNIDPVNLMKPVAPMGASSLTNNSSSDNRAVHQTFITHTTISGARDVREAGRMMEGTFGRMDELALENAQSAVA